ncbi:MAG: cytochrome c [Vicinamibacterales bacterium]
MRTAIACLGLALAASACTAPAAGSAAFGRQLYADNGCASCHGTAGRGDGPVGKTLTPPPRDFKDAAAYRNGLDEEAIAATLSRGIDRNGAKMPAFAHLSERERRSLALFVIYLRESPDERTAR